MLNIHWSLPLSNPVLVFLIVMGLILLIPLLLDRFRIPGLVGMILAGALLGPNAFNVLERSEAITLFGTVGLLYIMFWAGLEIDLHDFYRNRHKSFLFGALTFSIPLSLGFSTAYWVLNYPPMAALLLASMFSTHTLIAYPIVNRLGLARNEAVTIAIGGTIITDTLALLVLTFVSTAAEGELNWATVLRLFVALSIFMTLVWIGLPFVARWFFRRVESEGGAQYIFVLAGVFLSAFLAELAGMEPIIGAFLAGLALNRLIPHTSPLMSRIEFVGNYLFIPFFLISVGMLIDLRLVVQGTSVLTLSIAIISVAFLSKWLAAWGTQRAFGYSRLEREVIFGLSSAHAAATIAIILVGYNIQLLDNQVLNASVLLIFASCLGASIITDRSARKLAIQESKKLPVSTLDEQRILVPIANPANVGRLVDLAIMLRHPGSNEPIYPLSIILDDDETEGRLLASRRALDQVIRQVAESGTPLQPINRVDVNPAGGIVRTIKEMAITTIVIGWNGQITSAERFFGGVLDNVLEQSRELLAVCRIIHPFTSIKRIVVAVLPLAHLEPAFHPWAELVNLLAGRLRVPLAIWGDAEAREATMNYLVQENRRINIQRQSYANWESPEMLLGAAVPGDLLVLVSAREGSLSHQPLCSELPRLVAELGEANSFLIIYPAQAG